MNIKELKSKSPSDLEKLLARTRLEVKDLRFKAANGQLKDVRDIRENKKLIARIMTVLNMKNKENNK